MSADRRILRFTRLGPIPREHPDVVEHLFVATTELAELAHDGAALLEIGGIATVWELSVNGVVVHTSESMFARVLLDISAQLLVGTNTFEIRVLPLMTALGSKPRRPRPRWRTGLVSDNRLRWIRTTLLGRCSSIPSAAPVVGPWRPVVLHLAGAGPAVTRLTLLPRLDGSDGVLAIAAEVVGTDEITVSVSGPSGDYHWAIAVEAGEARAELRIPSVERWWPHTHGPPTLYEVSLASGGCPLVLPTDATNQAAPTARRVGFRTLAAHPNNGAADVRTNGIDLHVNGVRVFCRGVVWNTPDLADLDTVVALGLNMVRVPGIASYESDAFHDRCDELGVLVWQDLMFAGMDYPLSDLDFAEVVTDEISDQLSRLAGRPSSVVVCGGTEIAQQAAMLGLEADGGWATSTLGELGPALLALSGGDAIWVPESPCGPGLPFHAAGGVAHYFGVGAYRRPLRDLRSAKVRFAAECLAFSNVGDERLSNPFGPEWKRGVPRDLGAPWDFDDVREHYLAGQFGDEAKQLRLTDPERWLALSREVTGMVMAQVFADWRRAESGCGGGLVLWLRDLVPGAGWGLLNSSGVPKSCAWQLGRVSASTAVWMTDEGLNGVDIHLANDGRTNLSATLRVQLFRDFEVPVGVVETSVSIGAGEVKRFGVEQLLGRFVDASYAYRFGPPGHNLIVATLAGASCHVAPAVHFPLRPPLSVEPADGLGLRGYAERAGDGSVRVRLQSRRLVWATRVRADGYRSSDDAFCVPPGAEVEIQLRPVGAEPAGEAVTVAAVNMASRLAIPVQSVAT